MSKKILVVDDEEILRDLYQDALSEQGLTVHAVGSGEEAISILERDKFDAIVLDVNMPGMNGIEVLRRIKEKWKHLPVIINSAYHHYKQEFGTWLSDGYVVKSDDMSELKATIKNLLEKRKK